MNGHGVQLIIALVIIAIVVAMVSPVASNFSPASQAEAKATALLAEATAAKAALDLKYEDIRRGIMERGIAERDLKIEMDKAENLRVGELNTVNAKYAASIQAINTQRDLWRAVSVGGVILITGVSVALMFIAFALASRMRNRAKVVPVGTTSVILLGSQMFSLRTPSIATRQLRRSRAGPRR